ncbi:hypothetical protein ACWELQ_46110, partial [Nocardia sp. NPDC004722]
MAGKARTGTSRTRAGATRGQTPAQSRARTPRKPAKRVARKAPARRPAPRRGSNTAPLAVVRRGATRAWTATARGLGATTRAVSRAGDIEHGHRRDGIALGLVAFSFVIAAAVWLSAGGPVGHWVDTAVRWVAGSGIVDDLEHRGLVVRRRNPHDRRAYEIVITETG